MTRRPAAFITHPIFHAPAFGRHHPLSTSRQGAVVDLCRVLGWLDAGNTHVAPLPDVEVLAAFHDRAYLAALERVSKDKTATPEDRARWNLGTMECPVFEGLWDRARASVGGAILAADRAQDGVVAFHPAGGTHHGQPNRASGFCYLNDPVFAVRRLLERGAERVAYVDLDAHHGDGVEAAFNGDPRVALYSIHETGRWPGTGATGASDDGRIVNWQCPRNVGDGAYRAHVTSDLRPWLDCFGRDGLVVTLGADGLAGDPLSSMGLSNGLLWETAETCFSYARAPVILGGGGYNPWTTVRLWAGLWGRLIGANVPDPLPASAQAILSALSSDLVDDDDRPARWITHLED